MLGLLVVQRGGAFELVEMVIVEDLLGNSRCGTRDIDGF